MKKKKHSGEPSSYRESQSFKQNYAGTSLAKPHHDQKEPVDKEQKSGDSEQDPMPVELKAALEWFRDPKYHNPIIAGCAIGALVITAIYSTFAGLQWYAVRESNQILQYTSQVSQRAYVTIGRKDGTVAEFIVPKDPKQKAELILYFQNSGRVPAKLAWGTTGLAFIAGGMQSSGITYTHPFKGMARTKSKDGTIGETVEGAVIAGDSVFRATLGEIMQDRLADLSAKNPDLLTMGTFQYCDGLGTDVTHEFMITYRNAPDSSLNFRLLSDLELPPMPPVSTKEVEYLPPCENLKAQK